MPVKTGARDEDPRIDEQQADRRKVLRGSNGSLEQGGVDRHGLVAQQQRMERRETARATISAPMLEAAPGVVDDDLLPPASENFGQRGVGEILRRTGARRGRPGVRAGGYSAAGPAASQHRQHGGRDDGPQRCVFMAAFPRTVFLSCLQERESSSYHEVRTGSAG